MSADVTFTGGRHRLHTQVHDAKACIAERGVVLATISGTPATLQLLAVSTEAWPTGGGRRDLHIGARILVEEREFSFELDLGELDAREALAMLELALGGPA